MALFDSHYRLLCKRGLGIETQVRRDSTIYEASPFPG
eukprot:CAMPEP_0174329232 /NCGR_PEP_ID=MMETSP0810-20121108/15681_1 /TAXON_ID=73025 ORGANISM="Eutreptiella gymnastica-like, Strain CCMP1594" /NCGR_SAMPLE_ID=MMETSP0810 /ASSEMBLY_ACC=CAM_ASM_000659 /LENGTH=36 /DNA_ID= /DNA_START= /DNA_END= /DNA_ORIENTATION=